MSGVKMWWEPGPVGSGLFLTPFLRKTKRKRKIFRTRALQPHFEDENESEDEDERSARQSFFLPPKGIST
jgi:hypothetical protein